MDTRVQFSLALTKCRHILAERGPAPLLLSSENLVIGEEESLSLWYNRGDERKDIAHTLAWCIQRQRAKTSSCGPGLFPPFSLTGTNPPEIQGGKEGWLLPSSPSPAPLVLTEGTSSSELWHRGFQQAAPTCPFARGHVS